MAKKHLAQLKTKGIQPLNESIASTLLEKILAECSGQQLIMQVDWTRFIGHTRQPLLCELAQAQATDDSLMEMLRSIPADNREAVLRDHIRQQVALVLQWPSSSELQVDKPLFDMGMDSLTSVELRKRLEHSLGCEVPTTLAFDYPTIEGLAGALLRRICDDLSQPEDAQPAPLPSDTEEAEIQSLSDEAIASLISQQYDRMLEDQPDNGPD